MLTPEVLNPIKTLNDLDKKEKKFRTLFERSIDPIFLATEMLALGDVNNSFLQLLEYDSIEEAPLTLDQIFANTEDYQFFRNFLKDNGQIKDFEVNLMTKSGSEIMCLLNCVFIPDQGLEYCYQGIIHDLTLRKRAESDLLLAERLSLTGKMARTIAHEVRNPLTNLILALDQLREEIPDENLLAKRYGDIIERNANRIEKLVGEMLNSSRPDTLKLESTAINELLENTLTLATDRLELNQIQLIDRYHGLSQQIMVDKDKMKMALLNIIINAIESMIPGKGILVVETVNTGKHILITISDNGMGIPSENLGKLFDPFFTSKSRGMGLGLTSAKNIINRHGAHIEVKSEVNRGSTFCIFFKLANNEL